MLVLCFILIVALGVALGLWFSHHIAVDVDYRYGDFGPLANLPQAV